MPSSLGEVVSGVVGTSEISWGICVLDDGARVLAAHEAAVPLWTSSIGKVLLFIELACEIESDGSVAGVLLDRRGIPPVGEAGLWQHLRTDLLPLEDVVVLAASHSDNLATNVLLERVGVERVDARRSSLGLSNTMLFDRVRTHRAPEDPPNLSAGSADELALLMLHLDDGEIVTPAVSARVTHWLSLNADLSLAAFAFGLDPLDHSSDRNGRRLFNKTGSDEGVFADTGVVRYGGHRLSYAIIANWVGDRPDLEAAAVTGMRTIGASLRLGDLN